MFSFASRRRRRTKYYRYCQYVRCTKSLPRAIEPEDVRHLVRLTRVVRDKALILMLLRTGMRVGELLRIRIQDINLRNRKVIISESEKNRIGRVVYFSDDAKRALKAWYGQRDPNKEILFYGRGNNPLSYVAVRRMFCGNLEKSGLTGKSYTLHCLRHTYASELLSAGMSLESLQQLMGHISVETTRRYARLTDKSLSDDYFRAMSLIERGEIHGEYR